MPNVTQAAGASASRAASLPAVSYPLVVPSHRPLLPRHRWWVLGWLVPLALQLVHAAVVAPTYHVGSFDDDANYLMAAHVLAAGGGFTTAMPSGATVVANYLPGYPVLLVPLIWVAGGSLWAPRLLSTLCVAALYPLLWAWMSRRGVTPWCRVAVLGLLALNAVLAGYATMAMAEAPFLVVLVLVLLALDRWEGRPSWKGAAVVIALMAELVWLKEAAIGLVAGLVAYELWRRRWRASAAVGGGVALLLLPALVARWASGAATVGNRYAFEISNPSHGGLAHQLPVELYQDTWSYLQNVLRQSVLPSGGPLPATGPLHALVAVIGASVPVLSIVGSIVWYRRRPGPEIWMVGVYFLETLGYPYTNQRRVLLVLPLVTLWYVTGAIAAARTASAWWARRRAAHRTRPGGARRLRGARVAGAGAILAVGLPTALGFGGNYLYPLGEQGSEFAGAAAVDMLAALGPPTLVVETDYQGSVAFFSGHRTAWSAFTATTLAGPFATRPSACRVATVRHGLRSDRAAFLVVGDFSTPGLIDDPCLLKMASAPATARAIGAERLLSTRHDDTSLFELLGPGTAQPSLVDRTAGPPSSPAVAVPQAPDGQGDSGDMGYAVAAAGGRADFEWTFPAPAALSQVSVGSLASAGAGGRGPAAVTGVRVAIELRTGHWRTVATSAGPVGDGAAAPYLLAVLPSGTTAVGVRVTAATRGRAEVSDVDAIGPDGGPMSRQPSPPVAGN